MAKANRVKKSKEELRADLADIVEMLIYDCAAYDGGRTAFAKSMAVKLGTLLLGEKVGRWPLLHHLGIRQGRFLDTAPPYHRESTFPQCRLANLFVNPYDDSVSYIPILATEAFSAWRDFPSWWSQEPVISDMLGRTYTRMRLIQEMRNTEAAHADDALSQEYAELRGGQYMGWQAKVEGKRVPVGMPHLPCIRQIAHEMLLTLQEVAPNAFRDTYAFPNDPPKGLIVQGGPTRGGFPRNTSQEMIIDNRISIFMEFPERVAGS